MFDAQLAKSVTTIMIGDYSIEARPNVDSNTDVTRTEYYDVLGRRAYLGLNMSF